MMEAPVCPGIIAYLRTSISPTGQKYSPTMLSNNQVRRRLCWCLSGGCYIANRAEPLILLSVLLGDVYFIAISIRSASNLFSVYNRRIVKHRPLSLQCGFGRFWPGSFAIAAFVSLCSAAKKTDYYCDSASQKQLTPITRNNVQVQHWPARTAKVRICARLRLCFSFLFQMLSSDSSAVRGSFSLNDDAVTMLMQNRNVQLFLLIYWILGNLDIACCNLGSNWCNHRVIT